MSHRRWGVRGHDGLRREGDVLRRLRILEAASLCRRSHRSTLVHARRHGGIGMLTPGVLNVSLLRICDVRAGGRTRASHSHSHVLLSLLGLLHVAWPLLGREIRVAPHGDGLAAGRSSSHVSVLTAHTMCDSRGLEAEK